MVFHEPSWVFHAVATVQIVGLASAWLARASQGSASHALCQGLFFFALAIVSATAIASTLFPSGVWLMSGVTLSVMIVGTTCDFQRRESRVIT